MDSNPNNPMPLVNMILDLFIRLLIVLALCAYIQHTGVDFGHGLSCGHNDKR